ncbi:MAG TPA: hypothetical protein VFS49_04615 [Croceibacterium sp.]|nr:hypothetical protein [Croceibacterium sp.]
MTRRARLAVLVLACSAPLAPAAGQQDSGAPAGGAYVPSRTSWGDPDLRGIWPGELIYAAEIPLERDAAFGERRSMTDEEFAARLEAARKSDAAYRNDVEAEGTLGLEEWLESTPFARSTSQLVDPANGRLPPFTPEGEALYQAGRTSWHDGQPIDWVTDLDSYDRCVSRGFPASMLPWPSNDGLRVFQSPGFVVLQLEVLGTRIIPVGPVAPWPEPVRGWLGQSRGHWEGATLVIETTNIVAGDSATHDVWRRSGSPITGRAWSTVPTGERASAVERLTMTGPNTLAYEVTYSDPEVFTAPWTIALEWTRDSTYRLHEFACHEGNVGIRDMIRSSRAQRKLDARGPSSTLSAVSGH